MLSLYTVSGNDSDRSTGFGFEAFETLEAARERFAAACESAKEGSPGRFVLLCREDYASREDFELEQFDGFEELDSFRC